MRDENRKWSFGADHIGDGSYMKRWIIRTPWFTIRLHKILASDGRGDFHDHPFTFRSFILKGGYREHFLCNNNIEYVSLHYPGDIVQRDATDLHWLELLDENKPTWTLVFSGPYKREWGFLTRLGWIRHDIYKNRHLSNWGREL